MQDRTPGWPSGSNACSSSEREGGATDLEFVEAEEPGLLVQILDHQRQRVLHPMPLLAQAVQPYV